VSVGDRSLGHGLGQDLPETAITPYASDQPVAALGRAGMAVELHDRSVRESFRSPWFRG
jgi:hypothetical protein